MEMANFTWQDEAGNIKVDIEQDKCIACGRCVTVCKHGARYSLDDTELFFGDLSKGVPISLLVAPSIEEAIPEYKRLFTYLGQLGVNRIYDVSIGADINAWAQIRYDGKSDAAHIIAPPCPVIVSYCEIYRHDLLDRLSPVHSPVACASVYIQKYLGSSDRIAVISPCVAKANEFEETKLAQYNVTFEKLREYLEENNIELPDRETAFDPCESGLVPLASSAAKKPCAAEDEGFSLYECLGRRAQPADDVLSDIFDALSCTGGCNTGADGSSDGNMFDAGKTINNKRRAVTEEPKSQYYEAEFKAFDDTLEIEHFLREYQPAKTEFKQITDAGIAKAFELMGKTDYEKQNVDCGACGSKTCLQMARKIALGLNIPANCIVSTIETAKKEHAQSLDILAQFKLIWDSVESGIIIIDAETRTVVDVNPAAVRMHGSLSKDEMIGELCYKYFGQHECPILDLNQELEHEELTFVKADGTIIPITKSATKTVYNGRPVLLESFTDISRMKETEEHSRMLEVGERSKIMFDATPLSAHLWDHNLNLVDCNRETIKLFKLSSKQEYMDRLADLSPEFQPDGRVSKDAQPEHLKVAFRDGYDRFEWMRQTLDGEPIPTEVTLVRVDYKGESHVAAYSRDLREQKKMMQEINDTAARLNAIITNYPGLICSVDKNYRLTFLDGLLPHSFLDDRLFFEGQDLRVLLKSSRYKENIARFLSTYTEGAQDWSFETNHRIIRISTSQVYDDEGELNGIVAKFDDITEMMRIQNELQAALEKSEIAIRASEAAQSTISAMFESNPQINLLFNDEFKLIDCNPAAMNFFNFKNKEEMLEKFMGKLIKSIPENQPAGRVSVPLPERLKTTVIEGSVKFETVLVMDDVTRILDVEFKRIPYEGSFAVVSYIYDMTEIYEREDELSLAHELIKRQLNKLNLAAKATKVGIWEMEIVKEDPINPANTFMWSDEFRNMLGYENEEDFPNVMSSWSNLLHPDDVERTLEAFQKHLFDTTGETPYDVEYQLMKKDGEYSYFHASGETIRDEEGAPLYIAGALTDITETKNILRDTERQRIEAEAANQAKSYFLSTMSHEIRTPMNAILGITEIQLQNESLDSGVREALEKIYNSGDLLMSIINDILDLSKIEAGKMEIVNIKYEISSLISDTAQLNMLRIGNKDIQFELYVDDDIPAILLGDELRVKQILNNLLSNAFKYTTAGTVKLSVSSEPIGDDDKVALVFTVSDTGQGMTKEQVATLGSEYSRFNLETNRMTEGTGLGMNITQNLIRLMNGTLDIESEPGKGSVFTVHLPQGRTDSEAIGKEMAENLHQFRTSVRAQMKRVQISREPMPYGRILIVDDVETNIYVAKGLMAPYELQMDSANSGPEAIEKVKNGKVYDIIFMDHMMPKMDGIEATKIIRDLGYKEPIVALTANAVAGQADIFLENGFDDYISKPVDIRQLNAILNRLVRDKRSEKMAAGGVATSGGVTSGGVTSGVVANGGRTGKIWTIPVPPEAVPCPPAAAQPSVNPRFAEVFARDAIKALATLDEIAEKNDFSSEEDLRSYTITVHGMKSALANIGNKDLSAVAMDLEVAARKGNLDVLTAETPKFIDSLRAFLEELKGDGGSQALGGKSAGGHAKGDGNPAGGGGLSDGDAPYLKEKLLALKAACEEYDETAADKILSELLGRPWPGQTKELLDKISEQLLHSDFDEIVDSIDKF